MAANQITTSELKHTWFVLTTLVSKDFKLKYRRSLLGVLWSVLNPLLMMVVLSAVFSYMFRFEIDHYPLYLIMGQVLFSLMSDSTTNAMWSIINAAPLIKKVRVEKMVFPLETVIFSLLTFAISLIAVIAVMVFFQVIPTWRIILLPVLLVMVVLFCCGLGLLLSALSVFFRDIMHLWSVITMAWMYATPIFYPLSLLPEWMQGLMAWNPMYQYITYFRDIMMNGITPSLETHAICLVMALVTFALGLLVFRKTERKFILYV